MFSWKVLTVVLFCCFSPNLGDLVLTASPSTILPGVSSSLDLMCTLNPANIDSSIRVLAMQIMKMTGGGSLQGMASISLGNSDARLDNTTPGTMANGSIPLTNALGSFLQLTIASPKSGDSGYYVCAVSAMENSLLMNLRANVTVQETETSNDPQTNILLHELLTLKHQMSALTQKIQACACGEGGSRPTHKGVSFTARPSQIRPFRTGQRVIFDIVEVNIGGGYDVSRNQFTAPVNGTYVIMASMSLQEAKTLTDLVVNYERRGQLVTSDDDQTSISLVLDLKTGDEVWLQGIYDSHNATDTNIFADHDTLFSGFLIREH